VSRSAQIRETSLLEIPESAPKALTQVIDLARGSAVQVGLHHHREQTLINPAASLQQRRKKNDPLRSLGIRRSKSPAMVVNVRGREPIRWLVLVSVLSYRPAPIAAVSSASISA
jgi:hypothetical protein